VSAVGPATDVWALGAILYECLTGRVPFRGATVLDTIQQVMSVEPPRPRTLRPQVDPDLEAICLKCLQKEPATRYPSAQALAEELVRFLNGRPVESRPLGLLGRAYRWWRRRLTAR
jgi:serine/threonine protein kinase